MLFATTTAVTWGGQFVVGKSALGTVNAFPLSTVRYAVAALMWIVVLVALEGRGALRPDGRGLRLFWLGSLGFAGFNLLASLTIGPAFLERFQLAGDPLAGPLTRSVPCSGNDSGP
jgi:drug/metabolite transporter (DMT)-like permease